MELLRDGVLAFLAAVGLTTLVWMGTSALLHTGRHRIPGLLLVLPVRGDAPELENSLRELVQLRQELPEAEIVVADRGLSEESRRLARYLVTREEHASLVRYPEESN